MMTEIKDMEERGIITGKYIKKPDGTFVFSSLIFKPEGAQSGSKSMEEYWLPGAPFSYEFFVKELKRQGIVNHQNQWRKEVRGGKETASFMVVGCYECLKSLKCLPELSWPKVMHIFNSAFNTEIKNARVLEGRKETCDEKSFFKRVFAFSYFKNANTEVKAD